MEKKLGIVSIVCRREIKELRFIYIDKIGEKLPTEVDLAEMFSVGRSTSGVYEMVKNLFLKGVIRTHRQSLRLLDDFEKQAEALKNEK